MADEEVFDYLRKLRNNTDINNNMGHARNNLNSNNFYAVALENENLQLHNSLQEAEKENAMLKLKLAAAEKESASLQQELDRVNLTILSWKLGVELPPDNKEAQAIQMKSDKPKINGADPSPARKLKTWSSTMSLQMPNKKKHYAIFVGNLVNAIEDEELKRYFSKFGDIHYITFPKSGSARCNGFRYAFIKFHQSEAVEKIMMKKDEHKIKGSKILVNFANHEK